MWTLLAGVGVVGMGVVGFGADINGNAKSIHDSAIDFRFISYIPRFSFLRCSVPRMRIHRGSTHLVGGGGLPRLPIHANYPIEPTTGQQQCATGRRGLRGTGSKQSQLQSLSVIINTVGYLYAGTHLVID